MVSLWHSELTTFVEKNLNAKLSDDPQERWKCNTKNNTEEKTEKGNAYHFLWCDVDLLQMNTNKKG